MSGLFGRRARRYDEMVTDPMFPYQVGRLQGAADMAGHLLAHQQEPDNREIGAKLLAVAGWFFVPDGESLELAVLPPAPENGPVPGAAQAQAGAK